MSSLNSPHSAIILVIAFLLGSIPFGLLVARLFQVKDLSSRGSGNIGATNVSRVLGFWPAGAMTLALDMFKGMLPVILLLPPVLAIWADAAGLPSTEVSPMLIWATGLAAVLGHCYSPWLKFKGGKGVATGFGVLLILSPWSALTGFAAFVITFLSRRTGSLSSLAGLMVASITHLILYSTAGYLWFGALLILVILIRHESNLNALLESREKTF
ncbi:MAG: glycerol-3-phosphate 1-O-acyltransferase PlsY [Methylotenera sp.]|nr:glycerol-3-phosphate 1-O-acyltransferase PlsY [Oligoflexia bacterium]